MTALTKKARSLIAIQCYRNSKILQAKLTTPSVRKFYGLKALAVKKAASGKKASGKKARITKRSRK